MSDNPHWSKAHIEQTLRAKEIAQRLIQDPYDEDAWTALEENTYPPYWASPTHPYITVCIIKCNQCPLWLGSTELGYNVRLCRHGASFVKEMRQLKYTSRVVVFLIQYLALLESLV